MPLAATEKLAALPAVTDAAPGWLVIDGAVTVVTKASVAALLVAEPTLLLTTTVKLPASLEAVELMV